MSALSSSAAIRGATSHRPSALRVHPRRRTQRAARPRAAAPTRDVSLPTWDALEARIASDWPGRHRWVAQEAWRVVDCAVGGRLDDPIPPPVPDGVTALFRDRNGWCPYSERVWCGLMVARVPFVEVLVDNQGPKPRWYASMGSGGATPCVRWPDGSTQGESADILKAIDEKAAAAAAVGANVQPTPLLPPTTDETGRAAALLRFANSPRSLFPSNTRPSSRAAFLYDARGPLPRATFEATLDAVDAALAVKPPSDPSSPFFAGGEAPGAADCAWAPFLERYAAQLPLLHPGLHPRDAARWPHLAAWYRAMDDQPWYACRVAGDVESWAKVLAVAGYGNSGDARDFVAPSRESRPRWDGAGADEAAEEAAAAARSDLWARFVEAFEAGPEPPAPTLEAHVAGRLAERREGLVVDFLRDGGGGGGREGFGEADADAALRACVDAVLTVDAVGGRGGDAGAAAEGATRAMARYLGERLCVPRDLGAVPAAHMRRALRVARLT